MKQDQDRNQDVKE